MRLPDIMELEKFGFYAGFCTSASICTKLTLGTLRYIESKKFATRYNFTKLVVSGDSPIILTRY